METFQFLARFNQWVNGRLYPVVAEMPEEEYRRELGAFFGSIHQTLNHLLILDRLWTSRFTGANVDDIESVRDVVHDDFASLRRARDAMDLHIIETVDGLRDANFTQSYTFTIRASGREATMVGRHMLLAMFNHQTHHRGQVHCMLTQQGYAVPGLDVPLFAG